MRSTEIYLDHFATTPLDKRVLAEMMPYLTERIGNAASNTHRFGWEAAEAVEGARNQVAKLIGADRREIVFTSGATESNNLAIQGAAEAYTDKGRHIVSCRTEHPSVLDPLREIARRDWDVSLLGVDRHGVIDLEELGAMIREDTVLVSVMAANNEIGTLHPIDEIGELVRSHGALFHCDAAQAVGKISLDVKSMHIDLLSMSAHKLYGPKGVGALYVSRRNPNVRLKPLIYGGGHENGLRSGTVNVPGCVGLGEACSIAAREMSTEVERVQMLRDRLYRGLKRRVSDVALNGHPQKRLSGGLHVTFPGIQAEALMLGCQEVAMSSGSACSSATPAPSHVLDAIGLTQEEAECSVRFGIGRFTSEDEVDFAVERLAACIERVRAAMEVDERAPIGITAR